MKRIYQLQDLLNIVIWGTLILMGIGFLVLIYALITGDFSSIKFGFKGVEAEQWDAFQVIASLLMGVGYVLFFLAILKFKYLVSRFVKKEFFTAESIHVSKRIGLLFMLSPVFLYIPPFVHETIAMGHTTLNIISPESFFFLIIMGLFFLTLGYIFQEAKNLKEDNELTV